MAEQAAGGAPPSLRRRLLVFLLVPVGLLLLVAALLTYAIALGYANRVHDNDLSDDVLTLEQMLSSEKLDGELSEQARFLLEYDPDGHNYFTVVSRKRGLLAGNGEFPHAPSPPPGTAPVLYDSHLGKHSLRVAVASMTSPHDPDDLITVTIAETLRDRHQRAREILMLAVPLQTLLIVSVLSLVWFGVNYGLRVLQPLTRRLAARDELSPIGDVDVPQEILPLTRTIDGLFARLRSVLALQERFIADAAHQLRTPLAGLSLHVGRALADQRPETLRDALEHIRQLTVRTARTSAQLLALTRVQSPLADPAGFRTLALTELVPQAVGLRVHEALAAGVDLGYQGSEAPQYVCGDDAGLQELLDNLIDNGLHYAGRGSTVTVSVLAAPDGGSLLQVEDDGPGVPAELLPRLGERFFRVPSNGEPGTGLGLAIVQRIAERHRATVHYRTGAHRGLCVTVRFPPEKSC
ncbi:histidine kinase [Frateuria sp. Soil773]|uniref:sensor histidine kinase n=1 Tax=Frateuria sp. Soil773 TaxID=1736407 RepID=UPI0006F6AE50|nr:sensor histidine kinase [Frateuria sp. Soil773]KRE88416.1 histidine kinase [Frateuria sp. Soil773]